MEKNESLLHVKGILETCFQSINTDQEGREILDLLNLLTRHFLEILLYIIIHFKFPLTKAALYLIVPLPKLDLIADQ